MSEKLKILEKVITHFFVRVYGIQNDRLDVMINEMAEIAKKTKTIQLDKDF